MSPHTRRTVVVLLGLAALASLALPAPVRAQFRRPIPPRAGGVRLTAGESNGEDAFQYIQLPTDGRRKKKLDAARDYIKEKSWGEAARILQGLLDDEQDYFVDVRTKNADGKTTTTSWVTIKVEANRLLSTFPPEGLEHYRLSYEAPARDLLNRAKAANDPELLAQVTKRYLYTNAGQEGLRLCATHELDRGDYAQSAMLFEHLLKLEKQQPPSVLVQAALAFQRTIEREGPKADKEYGALKKGVWDDLTERVGSSVRLGDRTIPLAELRREVERSRRRRFLADNEWPNYRGNPARTDQGSGDKPFMEKQWSYPMTHLAETPPVIDLAVKAVEGHGQPVLPAFFPVAADGKVIYRDFRGLYVRDLRTGALSWSSPSLYGPDILLDPTEGGNGPNLLPSWVQGYVAMGKPGMAFENSVVGTLSADGNLVYSVEDLYVPPTLPASTPWGGMPQPNHQNFGSKLTEAIYSNTLNAYSLTRGGGKLVWTVSARADRDNPKGEPDPKGDENSESYFLGPPLPLHGKLYVLNEKNQDLRLMCLNPENGEPLWVQLLATTQTKLSQDVTRRIQAANLAYGEGILVCPTNAGMVLGVDLLSRSVLWAHPYRDKPQNPMEALQAQQQMMMMRRGIIMQGNPTAPTPPEWKVTAPVVQDGRVVFTAPDGDAVHCLNLRDGSLVWKAPRTDDDLYLAGVQDGKVLLVGKKECRALSLADGSSAWHVATGLPSGQGVFAGHLYYLPLKDGPGHEPEVCVLDVDRGKAVAHTKSRKQEVPGNLVLYEGEVISQNLGEVAVYPQLQTKLKQMEERIAKNPSDPVGLTERGELRLSDGDLPGAIDDLRTALKNGPPPEVRGRARARLYDALTDYLDNLARPDVKEPFDAAERFLPDYKELCKVEVPADASAEDRQRAEEDGKRRLGNYLCLVAKGREKQGRLPEALQHYLEFADRASRKELVSVPDEKAVRAPADVWAHGRISAMLAAASPAQRDELERLIARRWQALKDAPDTEALQKFVTLFGSEFRVGRKARFALAERLAEENGQDSLLKAERQLLLLAHQAEDRSLAARATEALARLMARNGLLPDAAHYYRVLGRDFADVPVRDGKTGADFLDDLATDKRFLPYLEEEGADWSHARVHVKVESGQFPLTQQLFHFEPEGEVLPSFDHLRVALEGRTNTLHLIGRDNTEIYKDTLKATHFFGALAMAQNQTGIGGTPRFGYATIGHVLVLPVGHLVYGIDPVHGRQLWEHSLLGPQGQLGDGRMMLDPRDNSVQIAYPDGWVQRLGQTGPALPGYVCLQERDGLTALDPVSGDPLWTRSDVKPRAGQVFGDDRHVYLVEEDQAGTAVTTRAFRAADGVSDPSVPSFTAAYKQRRRIDGARILAADGDLNGLTVRLYDIPTGKDVWKKKFRAGSVVVHCEDPHLGAVLESDGLLTVLDLRTAKEVLQARAEAKDVDRVQGATLVADGSRYYLAINNKPEQARNNNPWGGAMSNFQAISGYRSVPVNGRVYAFDRKTGKVDWFTQEIFNQMLVLEQLRDLPVLIMTSRNNRIVNAGNFNRLATDTAVTVVEKRTGKLKFDDRGETGTSRLPNAPQFYALNVDLREGKIELVSFQLKVVITLEQGSVTTEARANPTETR